MGTRTKSGSVRRVRPSTVAWEREVGELLAKQERDGMLSEAAVEEAAERLGVGAVAVRGRFGEEVRRLVRRASFVLTRSDIELIRTARNFPTAHTWLVASGATARYAVVERGLWQVPGRELAALQARERRRRVAFVDNGAAATMTALAA
jgi:hypothetical protein